MFWKKCSNSDNHAWTDVWAVGLNVGLHTINSVVVSTTVNHPLNSFPATIVIEAVLWSSFYYLKHICDCRALMAGNGNPTK